MNFVDELERLERLRQQGMLSDAELKQAKAKLLGETSSSNADVEQIQQSELKKELELARLDRAWQYEKEGYMVQQRYGGSRPPSVFYGVIAIFVGAGFGGFLLWLWSSILSPREGLPSSPVSWVVPLAGLFAIFGSLWNGFDECNKASEYSSRKQVYYRQREQISSRSS